MAAPFARGRRFHPRGRASEPFLTVFLHHGLAADCSPSAESENAALRHKSAARDSAWPVWKWATARMPDEIVHRAIESKKLRNRIEPCRRQQAK